MLKNLRQFTFWLTLIVAVSCCKHDTEPSSCECGEVNSIEELKEWAFFKEGTYWIYEEESTGARDTFTVVSSNDFVTDQGNVQFDYETYRSSDGYYYWFWFNEGWTAHDCKNGCCDCRRLWCDKYIAGDADGEDVLLTFPTFVESYSYLGFGGGDYGMVKVTNFYSEIQFGDNVFYSVVEEINDNSVLDQQPDNYNYYQVKYFFCRSIGIIRKEISETSQIWNLVEYNIEQ
jgi:hypothetical protein